MKATLNASGDIYNYGYDMSGCMEEYDSDVTMDFFDRYLDERIEASTWDCDRKAFTNF